MRDEGRLLYLSDIVRESQGVFERKGIIWRVKLLILLMICMLLVEVKGDVEMWVDWLVRLIYDRGLRMRELSLHSLIELV